MTTTGLLEETVDIPDGVEVRVDGERIAVRSKDASIERKLSHPRVAVTADRREVRIRIEFPSRRYGALVGTFAAHIRNMIEGVTKGFTYEMKVVYSHFPIKASVKGPEFLIENFLGEKFPRKARILGSTKVEVKGDQILLTGSNLEEVSQTAANIEQATRIRGFDSRVFQDGIYITVKAGEAL